jgi:WhiB family transcriptional regulator, redox-sensing transcriptional regulator
MWQDQARCATEGADTDLFYPPRDREVYAERAAQARAYCYGESAEQGLCPVIRECLLYALVNKEQHGIWGGLSNRERRRLAQRRRLPDWITHDDLLTLGMMNEEEDDYTEEYEEQRIEGVS